MEFTTFPLRIRFFDSFFFLPYPCPGPTYLATPESLHRRPCFFIFRRRFSPLTQAGEDFSSPLTSGSPSPLIPPPLQAFLFLFRCSFFVFFSSMSPAKRDARPLDSHHPTHSWIFALSTTDSPRHVRYFRASSSSSQEHLFLSRDLSPYSFLIGPLSLPSLYQCPFSLGCRILRSIVSFLGRGILSFRNDSVCSPPLLYFSFHKCDALFKRKTFGTWLKVQIIPVLLPWNKTTLLFWVSTRFKGWYSSSHLFASYEPNPFWSFEMLQAPRFRLRPSIPTQTSPPRRCVTLRIWYDRDNRLFPLVPAAGPVSLVQRSPSNASEKGTILYRSFFLEGFLAEPMQFSQFFAGRQQVCPLSLNAYPDCSWNRSLGVAYPTIVVPCFFSLWHGHPDTRLSAVHPPKERLTKADFCKGPPFDSFGNQALGPLIRQVFRTLTPPFPPPEIPNHPEPKSHFVGRFFFSLYYYSYPLSIFRRTPLLISRPPGGVPLLSVVFLLVSFIIPSIVVL